MIGVGKWGIGESAEREPAGLWSLQDITGARGNQANTDLPLDTSI